jgi:hypothetical protein
MGGAMRILSLKSCADHLGIATRKLRYLLDKNELLAYRALDLGGGKHVRWFSTKDLETLQQWWEANKHTGRS